MTNFRKKNLKRSSLKILYFNNESFNKEIVNTDNKNFFDSASNYYQTLYKNNTLSTIPGLGNCFAVKLAKILIELIDNNKFKLTQNNRFRKNFYDISLKEVINSSLSKDISDPEVLLIYIKQIIHILRSTDIIGNEEGVALINNCFNSSDDLFYILFHGFWEKVKWDEIFPSDKEAANDLKKNKSMLVDIIIRQYKKIQIDTLANNFFELTGFSDKNDLFMISFLDFYFFTWLKHFGILNYINIKNNPSIYLKINEKGRKFLSTLI